MRCQVLSGLWNAAIRLRPAAPTLILCGNIGRLGPTLFTETRAIAKDFKTVFWVPYAAETFREDGSAIDSLIVREMINEKSGTVCLSNDVIVHEGRTVVATSGWWPGYGGAANSAQMQAWSDEDRDFIQENCGMDTILLTAGSMYCRKPTTLVGGVVPPTQDNMELKDGRQLVVTNCATANGFDSGRVFELR
jgi:hypothetical protein